MRPALPLVLFRRFRTYAEAIWVLKTITENPGMLVKDEWNFWYWGGAKYFKQLKPAKIAT